MKGYPITEADPDVMAMAHMDITGNVLPPQWLKHITTTTGRPYLVAAIVLSDLVYWYRPVVERSESTGLVVGYRKKFAGDLLQRSHDSLADMYGFTKRQIQDAAHRLEQLGLVRRVLRTVEVGTTRMSNVLFWKIYPDAIAEITFDGIAIPKKRDSSPDKTGEVSRKIGTHNTESTTGNSTETKTVESPHQRLMRLYQEALGYPIPAAGREAVSAKAILKAYTPEDAMACYAYLKTDPFWANKPVALATVNNNLGEWVKAGKPATFRTTARAVVRNVPAMPQATVVAEKKRGVL